MANEQDAIIQAIVQAAIEAAKAGVQEVMAAREEATTRHRNEAASIRPK